MKTIAPQEFFNKYEGKLIIRQASVGAQCAAEANQFIEEVHGYQGTSPIAAPTAYEMWLNMDHPDFVKVETNDITQFVLGDQIIYAPTINPDSDFVHGGAGHINTFIKLGDNGGFYAFDQNYPVGSPCHTQFHANNKHIVGAIRHKSLIQPTQPEQKKIMNIAKTGQMIWVKQNDVTEFWVIYKKTEIQEDGSTKEIEVKRPVKQHITLCAEVFANNDQFHRWSSEREMALLAGYPEGKEYDITEQFKNHPELFEK